MAGVTNSVRGLLSFPRPRRTFALGVLEIFALMIVLFGCGVDSQAPSKPAAAQQSLNPSSGDAAPAPQDVPKGGAAALPGRGSATGPPVVTARSDSMKTPEPPDPQEQEKIDALIAVDQVLNEPNPKNQKDMLKRMQSEFDKYPEAQERLKILEATIAQDSEPKPPAAQPEAQFDSTAEGASSGEQGD